MATSKEKEEPLKNQINLNPIRRLFVLAFKDTSSPQRDIEPYVTKGQVVADLGCDSGYYTFALAEGVGPEGRVYAVDLDEKKIIALKKKGG